MTQQFRSSVYIPKGNENVCLHRNLSVSVHSSIVHNSQRVETYQMSINWWMDEQHVIYPCNEIGFAIKRMDYDIYHIAWMNLKSSILSERNQSQKAAYHMSLFIWIVQKRQIHGNRKQMRGCPRQGVENGGYLLVGMGFLSWVMKMICN